MMKCFMSKFKRVAIERIFWKTINKHKDYMRAINVWDNMQNDFNTKYMANNKQKNHGISLQSHVIFKYLSEYKECT